ncbi:AAA family ATPase [Campylobacter sp. faydin G-24]|uniref:AAA family ATPase n=1 Tax=Campylobacter anatolicus TaxID=2829105 RepID=A0ABS5HHB1_9BACT|nr:AAA family ATPase [Campylobacter anatolicus]MBR8463638.1 AAA family ATPase [Campylobacter anatolicus]
MSDIFKFLDDCSLRANDFDKKHEFLIDGFLPAELITMIYSAGGSGKTFLAYAITSKLCKMGKKVFYIDFDNPVNVLKERKCDELLINRYENLRYIQRSSVQIHPYSLILELEKSSIKGTYDNCVFILDSLINFCDLFNDNHLMKLFDALKNMREAGATIIVLHHANKDGKNYQGSTCIRNAIDCMYKLSQKPANIGELNFVLEVAKERAAIVDSAFNLKIDTLELNSLEKSVANMSEYEFSFTTKATAILKESDRLSKTEFLNALGYEKDDKTARECLDKFDGRLWFSNKVGKTIFYSSSSTALQLSSKDTKNSLLDTQEAVINE